MKACCHAFLAQQFGGDEGLVKEIYEEYASAARGKAAELAAAAAVEDWAAVDRLAHTMKGNALVAGDQEAVDAAIALRGASKLQDRAQAAELAARLLALAAEL